MVERYRYENPDQDYQVVVQDDPIVIQKDAADPERIPEPDKRETSDTGSEPQAPVTPDSGAGPGDPEPSS